MQNQMSQPRISEQPDSAVELCEKCGQSREVAEFYGEGCYDPAEFISVDGLGSSIPGPVGEHTFIRFTPPPAPLLVHLGEEDEELFI